MKKITQFLTLIFTLLIISSGYAQKVAIIGMNHNSSSPNTDGFSFVATEIITNGEVIYFTENEYDAASNVFTFGIGTTGEGVVKFTATSAISTGTVIFVNETGTSTNIFTVSCTSGGACGTAIIAPLGGSNGNGGFSLGTSGDGLYAYSDTNENVRDAIGVIYSVMYTTGGGNIPANESPISDFPNAIIVDGFPASNPDRTEFKFSPTSLRDGVSQVGLENPINYLHAQTNQALSIIEFTNINLTGADPLLTLTSNPASILENAAGTYTYTFTLGAAATSDLTVDFSVGGTATFNTDYTASGANTINASSGSVIILNGNTTVSFTIDPTGDTDLEPDETIVLTVINGSGYDPGSPSSSTSTIANDDNDATIPLVAVTGLNHVSTAPAVDGFSFVALDDIPGTTTIYFTENKYNNTTLAFSGAEGVVSYTTPPLGLLRGDVVVATETGTSTNVFDLTCNGTSGAACGTVAVVSGNFSIDTLGESFYAYSDTDSNPNNGVTAIYSLLYTGESGGPSGSNVPVTQDPASIYSNAVVVDGFINAPPNRTEYKFAGGERAIDVGLADFQNPSNWLHANANATLSAVPFNNIIITTGTVNPIATVAITPNSVAEDSGTGMVYTFSLSTAPTTDVTINFTVGGTATYSGDYVETGADTFDGSIGTVIILNGNLSASVTITPVIDSDVEPLETVILALASGTGYNGGSPNDATGSITNDDTSNSDPLVAITGMNHVTPDGFSFVAAKDIPAGTTIYFTENEFDNTTLMFTTGEGVFMYTSPGAVIPAGDVIVIKETTPDVFSLTCNGNTGAPCGSIVLVSANLAHDTLGESLYAYEDSDNDPSNGVVDIYAVMFTGTSSSSGGNIPAGEDPSGIYLSALVIDGFSATAPGRTEYRFALGERAIPVSQADFEDTTNNWLHAETNADLSPIPFAILSIIDAIPPVAMCKNITVQLDGTGSATIVGADVDNGSNDNIGIASLSVSPDTFDCTDIASVTVILTVADAAGNTATCTADITVEDSLSPSITCPGNQNESADANCVVSLPDYTGSAITGDNCDGSPVVSQLPIPGTTISGVGTVQTVTLRATDASGNWAECTFDVEVHDNSAPSISCPGNQGETADANCDVSLPDYTGSATTSDNCDGSPAVSQLPIPGTTISGTQTVTLRATDASGNWAECTFDVTVIDNTAPSISCPGNQDETADANCDVSLPDYTGSATTGDNCDGSPVVSQLPIPGTIISGTQTVTLRATDASGNWAECSFDVTVKDNTAPSISCPGNQGETADANCDVSLPDYTGFATTDDNCDGSPVVSQLPISGTTISGAGTVQTVTLRSTDASGNWVECTFDVEVQDNSAPSISCPGNQDETADANCDVSLPDYTGLATTSDNCDGSPVVSQLPIPGTTISGVGTMQTVTLRSTDANGNWAECTFDVEVQDNSAPSISCPGNQDETADANCDVSLPDYTGSATTDDNCDGSPVVSQLPIPGTTISGAETVQTVTLRSTDASGNWAECSFDVTVKDNTAPSISCPGNQDETADANCDVSLPDYTGFATTSDNCDGSPVVSQLPIPGTTISGAGTVQTVTLRSTDASGNYAECTFDVTVRDNTEPSISCVSNQFKDTDPGQCDYTVVGTEFDPTGFDDNCPGSTIENDYDNTDSLDGSVFPVGTTTVVWTVTDASNNTKICSFDVTVGDDEDPTISCPADVVITSVPGECNTPVVLGTPTFNDNCPGTTVLNDAPASFPFGVTSVTWTATDASGNTAHCIQIVTVNKINTITSVTVNPSTQQYSDMVTFEATIDPGECVNAGVAADRVKFSVGTQIMGTVILSVIGGVQVGTLTVPLVEFPSYPSNGQMAPGNYIVTAEFIGVNPNFSVADPTTDLTIIQEDAIVDYTGQSLQATPSSNASEALVVLSANIQDITVSDFANDSNAGDIRNAIVKFVNRDTNTDISGWIPVVDLVNPADNRTGTVTFDWLVDIGNANSESHTVGIIVDGGGYYYRNSSEDNTVVTVYKPTGDFITGGGHIIPDASDGIYASTPGLKTNFGFNVKYNRRGTKVKGKMNIIFRRLELDGIIHVYQIKSNAIQSLGVNIADEDNKIATFIAKSNLKDITDPSDIISLGGNLTLKVDLTDRGEPGIEDSIAFNLINNSSTLLFSSNWTGISTEELTLTGGNLVVHSGFSNARLFEMFEVDSQPNPSDNVFNLKVKSSSDALVHVVVFDVNNKIVHTDEFNPKKEYEFGSKLQSGLYFVQVRQGSNIETIRLIKY
ncbi:hypothetical protein A9Q87_01340 [Flavobacteriales bacterium 34_180_T64]|nr:hypothetical protein A9Q87_01340 [Flavobacteriales bacterium 34_180_T64]